MTSYFRSRWSDIDEVWQFYAEFYADYSDVVKVETGRRISIWRTFVFVKRKQLYLGGRLIYPDDIRCADRHLPSEKSDVTQSETESKIGPERPPA